jgi:O-antigen/teichoic acid export membrane protein
MTLQLASGFFRKWMERRTEGHTRYLATGGTAMMAAAHFIGSIVVLHNFGKTEFGLYSFMFTAMQLTNGISNAMICAPYSVNAQQSDHTDADEKLYFQVNLLFCSLAGAGAFALGWMVGLWQASLTFSVWIFFSAIRWFLRNYCFSKEVPLDVFISDFAYSLVFCCGLVLLVIIPNEFLMVGVTAAAAALAGLLVNREFLHQQRVSAGFSLLRNYLPIWKEQSRWALLGVTTTEATANAHAWLVTLWAGPAAFAPIAAAGLFFKPMGLIASAMTQVERPEIARLVARQKYSEIRFRLKQFRLILMSALGMTICAIVAYWFLIGDRLIKPGYDAKQLLVALVLLASISLVSSWRMPESVAMQALSKFKALSVASVYSGLFTVVLAILLITMFDSVYSLIAVLLGQLFLAIFLKKLFNQAWPSNA